MRFIVLVVRNITHFIYFQFQQCQEMYDKLHLDRIPEKRLDMTSHPFPFLRGHTMINQTRPLTYSVLKESRPVSLRSAPLLMLKEDSMLFDDQFTDTHAADGLSKAADDNTSDTTDCDYDENGYGRKRNKLDPEKLCDHLQHCGLGLPAIVTNRSSYKRVTQTIPRNMRSRPLPRNPSKREKIKGRARLDQELANMKALAFCEQQAPKVFRTASANMRNRDVQFVEDEFKEHMQREGFDAFIDDIEDDDASVVRMPVKHEELFLRINNWVTEVENSCKVYINPELQSEVIT